MDSPYSSPPGLAMPIPLSFSSSTIAIPSLDTIPGSAAPTPSIHESDAPPTPPPLAQYDGHSIHTAPSDYLTPSEGSQSRRGSLAGIPGSYFPSSHAGPSRTASTYAPSPSGTSTPGDRPRPAPLAIPLSTPDTPLFSAYPDQGSTAVSRNNSKGKGRAFAQAFKPSFNLSHPPLRRKHTQETPATTSGESSPGSRPAIGRRRASTFSGSPPLTAVEQRRPSKASNRIPSPKVFKQFRRRRMSLGGREEESYTNTGYPHWPSMPAEEARRFDQNARLPFSYLQPAESDYTLQSVSTVATVRPLSASPNISPRRSSLTPLNAPRVMLGLTNISNPDNDAPISIVIPDDMVMPHGPPPRHSSLDAGGVKLHLEPKYLPEADAVVSADMGSVLSASLTGTDTSASAEFFSTSPSSKEHPLSSATTSLSRSAKSSKEGGASDEKDAALTAIRLQRSLEWEARQTRHRRRLEKKRMILLELVETEVGYTEDLKKLVQVYLPQLYALPSVSERTADLVARNAKDLLDIHLRLASKMVAVLKEEHLGYEPCPEPVVWRQLERVSRRLAAIFVEEVSFFSAYNEYCAGSIAAATLVRHISQRPEYTPFERRCQIISASQHHATLQDMLAEDAIPVGAASVPSSPHASGGNRSRLHFRDFLIMPIQRICRYPLLLSQLLNAATTPSPEEETSHPEYAAEDVDGDYDTGVDVERALGAMRGVAEEADEARRLKENEIKSATIIERLEPHQALTPAFLKSLGMCRLIGSLDVLHHHPTVAPLVPPVKVKYMGAFLYKGYLILAKIKKGKVYEAKHFLPLEVFELIDITEGFLPHSIRLSLREHNFDLAASCDTEKEVWASALCQARDESTVPPFELPASVSPFAARSRRMSAVLPPDFTVPLSPTLPSLSTVLGPDSSASKRHTIALSPEQVTFPLPPARAEDLQTPAQSPTRTSFGSTPDRAGRPGQPSTILLRRASTNQRLHVDRALIDVFSESCATARSKAQLHHTLFLPDVPTQTLRTSHSIRDSASLRRRRSFLDSHKSSSDIAFTGEIRGSVMPIRQTRSLAGKRRTHPGKRFSIGNGSSTEVDHRGAQESADETATSDFGTLTRNSGLPYSRAHSMVSVSNSSSPAPPMSTRQSAPGGISALGLVKRKSLTNIRKSMDIASESTTNLANMLTLNRRKTASTVNLNKRYSSPNRAKSVPVSPVGTPYKETAPPLPAFPPVPPRNPRRPTSQFGAGVFSMTAASDDQAVPIFARGQGLTNQSPVADRERPNLSAWSSLRRSMSFIRDPRDESGNSASNSGSGASGLDVTRPNLSRHSTDDGFDGGASSAGFSDPMSNEDEDESTDTHEKIGGGSARGEFGIGEVVETPRRRKSVRIFQTLSRFTPI